MAEQISWLLLAMLATLLVAAAVTDLKKREIPHTVVIAIALLAPLFWWSTGLSLWPDAALQIGIALVVFALFAAAFAFGWMGGGDVKLLSALVLWLPAGAVLTLLVIMSVFGGALTAATMIHHRVRRAEGAPEIPYGVAIAFAGLWLIGERFFNQFG